MRKTIVKEKKGKKRSVLLLFQVRKASSFVNANTISRWHICGSSTFR